MHDLLVHVVDPEEQLTFIRFVFREIPAHDISDAASYVNEWTFLAYDEYGW